VHVRLLSCCETKPRILSNQTCGLPTVLISILWTTRYREWCRKVFIRSQWGPLMSWSSIWLQHGQESNRASLMQSSVSAVIMLWMMIMMPRHYSVTNFELLGAGCNRQHHISGKRQWQRTHSDPTRNQCPDSFVL